LEQFQNKKKIDKIDTATHIHDPSLFWLEIGTSIKSGRIYAC
jgi:hypothetical protein